MRSLKGFSPNQTSLERNFILVVPTSYRQELEDLDRMLIFNRKIRENVCVCASINS